MSDTKASDGGMDDGETKTLVSGDVATTPA